jgi:hypothetical protein
MDKKMRLFIGLAVAAGAVYGAWYGTGIVIRKEIVARYGFIKEKLDGYTQKNSIIHTSLLPETLSESDLHLSGFPFSWTFTLPPLTQKAWDVVLSDMEKAILKTVGDNLVRKEVPPTSDRDPRVSEMENAIAHKVIDTVLVPLRQIDLKKYPTQLKVTWQSLRYPHSVWISTKGAPVTIEANLPVWGKEKISMNDSIQMSKRGIEKVSGSWVVGDKSPLSTVTYEGSFRPYAGKISFALHKELLTKVQEKLPDLTKFLKDIKLDLLFPLKVDIASELVYPKECPDSLKGPISSDVAKCFPVRLPVKITMGLGKETVTILEEAAFSAKANEAGGFEGGDIAVKISLTKKDMDQLVSIIASLTGQQTMGMIVGGSLGFLFASGKDDTVELDVKVVDNKVVVNGMPLPLPESSQREIHEVMKKVYEFLLTEKRNESSSSQRSLSPSAH